MAYTVNVSAPAYFMRVLLTHDAVKPSHICLVGLYRADLALTCARPRSHDQQRY